MPTRPDVTVSADADSLMVALTPLGPLTARSDPALLPSPGSRILTTAVRSRSLRAPSPESGWGGAA